MPISRRRLPVHVLDRPRLLRRLEASEAQVIAVIAPAGYGKTTLLTQFAALSKRPVAWLTLDDSSADAAALAGALAAALMVAFPRAKFASWKAALALGALPHGLAAALAEDVNQLQRNAVMVLDRLERLSVESSKWLEGLFEILEVRHQVVLAGYEGSFFPVTRFVADDRAIVLGTSDLAFTQKEAQVYLQRRGFIGDAAQAAQALEGWAVGLALLASGSGLASRADQLIFEVLQRLPLPLRNQIAEAAVLEVWDEQSAVQLGCVLPQGWLQAVVNAGLPLQPLGTRQYLPHSILLAALEVWLRRVPERHAELHCNAAVFAERSGLLLEALRHFRVAGALLEVHRIAEAIIVPAVNREEFYWVKQLLESFLPAELSVRLQLRLAQAWRQTGDVVRANEVLQQVQNSGVQDALLFGLLAIGEYNQGHYERQIEFVQQGLALDSDVRMQAKLLMSLAAGFAELGRVEKDVAAAEEAVHCAELSGDQMLIAATVSVLAASYGSAGRRTDCERMFRRALDICEKLDLTAKALVSYNNFANYLSDWGRVTEALNLVQKGIPLARASQSFWLALLLGTQGIMQLRLGDFMAALHSFSEGIERCQFFGLGGVDYNYQLFSIQAAILAKDLTHAENLLIEARVSRPTEASIQLNRLYFAEGMFAFAGADFASAKDWFLQIDGVFDEFDQPRLKAYLAEIARREGSLTRALVSELVEVVHKSGHSLALVLEVNILQGLYQECIRRNWYPEVFQELTSSVFIEDAVLLEVDLFAKPKFLVAKVPIKIPLAKSRELLAWSVLNGAGTRDEIVQALWGDVTNKRNLEYFKIALRKLRASLYESPSLTFDPILFENGAYVLHPRLQVLCVAKNILDARDDFPSDIAVLESLFLGYKGVFLSGIDSPWVVEMRQVLLDVVVSIGEQLGLLLLESDVFKAIRIFKRVLELDALSDVALCGLQSQVRVPLNAEARVLA